MKINKRLLYLLCILCTAIVNVKLVFALSEKCVFETYTDGIETAHIGDRQIYTLFTEHLGLVA